MLSGRAQSEELRIIVPVGASRSVWERAFAIGLQFASEFIDRPSGWSHCVAYRVEGQVYVAYWTRARRVVVYLNDEEVSRG